MTFAKLRTLGVKLLMTTVHVNGRPKPLTVFYMSHPLVLRIKDTDFGMIVFLAFFPLSEEDARRATRAHKGLYACENVQPHHRIVEIRLESNHPLCDIMKSYLHRNIPLSALFTGRVVHVTDAVKGRGFCGVMKRWNFAGLGASHGVSVSHRSHGSTGQRSYPGKVMRGKRMAGRYGGHLVNVRNLIVSHVNDDECVIGVLGCTPGHYNSVSTLVLEYV